MGNTDKSLKKRPIHQMSRRERQIMEIIYSAGRATAQEVASRMQDSPSYSAVRALLRVLEEKGHLRHRQEGPRYVYLPTVPRDRALRSALRNVASTFFDGSTEGVLAAFLEMESSQLSAEELDRLSELIEQAKIGSHRDLLGARDSGWVTRQRGDTA